MAERLASPDREKIVKIENQLDDFNAKYGTEGNLCLFCYSKTYNGRQGIIHNPDCLILSLRSILALIPDDKLVAEIFEEIEKVIDGFMANGKYVVEIEGVKVRCLGADMLHVWEKIKQSIQALKSRYSKGGASDNT